MTGKPTIIHAEPFTKAELDEFEALIFTSNLDDHAARLRARADLADFLNEHGSGKCDLMTAVLSKKHEQPQEH